MDRNGRRIADGDLNRYREGEGKRHGGPTQEAKVLLSYLRGSRNFSSQGRQDKNQRSKPLPTPVSLMEMPTRSSASTATVPDMVIVRIHTWSLDRGARWSFLRPSSESRMTLSPQRLRMSSAQMSALLIWISPQYLLHIKLTAAQEQETAGDEDQGKTEPIKATQAKQVMTENQTQREQEKARHVSRRTGGRDNAASKLHVQISSSADAETNPTNGFSGILLVVSIPRLLYVHLTLKGSEGFQSPIPDYEERGIFPAHVPSLWLLMLIPIRMKLVMSSPARRCTPSLTSESSSTAGRI